MNWEGNALFHTDVRQKASDIRRASPDRSQSPSRNALAPNTQSQVFVSSQRETAPLNLRLVEKIVGTNVGLGALEDEELVN